MVRDQVVPLCKSIRRICFHNSVSFPNMVINVLFLEYKRTKQKKSFPAGRKEKEKRANPFDQGQTIPAQETVADDQQTFGREVDDATMKVSN